MDLPVSAFAILKAKGQVPSLDFHGRWFHGFERGVSLLLGRSAAAAGAPASAPKSSAYSSRS
eukprot:1109683-Prymnesium_polylepis.1